MVKLLNLLFLDQHLLKEFEILGCLWEVRILDILTYQSIDVLVVIAGNISMIHLLLIICSWNILMTLVPQGHLKSHICLSEIICTVEPGVLRIYFD